MMFSLVFLVIIFGVTKCLELEVIGQKGLNLYEGDDIKDWRRVVAEVPETKMQFNGKCKNQENPLECEMLEIFKVWHSCKVAKWQNHLSYEIRQMMSVVAMGEVHMLKLHTATLSLYDAGIVDIREDMDPKVVKGISKHCVLPRIDIMSTGAPADLLYDGMLTTFLHIDYDKVIEEDFVGHEVCGGGGGHSMASVKRSTIERYNEALEKGRKYMKTLSYGDIVVIVLCDDRFEIFIEEMSDGSEDKWELLFGMNINSAIRCVVEEQFKEVD